MLEEGEDIYYFCSKACKEQMKILTPRLLEDREDEPPRV